MSSNSNINYDEFIKLYKESNLSLKKFCDEYNISIYAMKYHMYHKGKQDKQFCNFVKLDITDKSDKHDDSSIIHFKGFDIELTKGNIDVVLELIRRLSNA